MRASQIASLRAPPAPRDRHAWQILSHYWRGLCRRVRPCPCAIRQRGLQHRNDEKSLSGSRAGESSKPATQPDRGGRTAPRVAKKRRWRRPIRWRVACRRDEHTLWQQYRARCHLRWQDHGGMELRSGRPQWRLDRTRIRRGSELDQFRPYDGPQRLRFIRPIRRLYRALDPRQTVGKTPFFRGFSPLQLRRRVSPNYTPSAPKLRLIATQVSDQIGSVESRVALRCRG